MGFSVGGALALYAAQESQTAWPGRVKAVVSMAPTVGNNAYGKEHFNLFCNGRLTPPIIGT